MYRTIVNLTDSLNYAYAKQPYETDGGLYIRDPAAEQDWPTMPDGKSGKGGSSIDGPYNQRIHGDDADNKLELLPSVANMTYNAGYVYGKGGNDVIRGARGIEGDYLSGGDGNDIIYAVGEDDNLFGGNGNDVLYGDSDKDWHGRNGDTMMHGGSGSDSLYGGNGNDKLDGGYGRDWLKGGGGADTFQFCEMDRAWWSDDGIEDFSRVEGDKIHLINMRDWNNNHISVKGFDDLNIVDYGNHWKVFIADDIKFGVLKGDYGHLQASDFIFDSA